MESKTAITTAVIAIIVAIIISSFCLFFIHEFGMFNSILCKVNRDMAHTLANKQNAELSEERQKNAEMLSAEKQEYISRLNYEKQQCSKEISDLKANLFATSTSLDTLEKQNKESLEMLTGTTNVLGKSNTTLQQIIADAQKKTDKVNSLESQLEEAKSKISSLEKSKNAHCLGFNIQHINHEAIDEIVKKEAEIIEKFQMICCRVIERLGGPELVATQLANSVVKNNPSICNDESTPSFFSLFNVTKMRDSTHRKNEKDSRNERYNQSATRTHLISKGGSTDEFELMSKTIRNDRSLTPSEKEVALSFVVLLKEYTQSNKLLFCENNNIDKDKIYEYFMLRIKGFCPSLAS